MPVILRKSFTACEALAALPPTPRMKSLPPAWRVSASRWTMRAIESASSPSITVLASERNCLTNSMPSCHYTPRVLLQIPNAGE